MFYYRSDIYRDKKWIETDETDPQTVIEKHYRDRCYVNDADQCGDGTVEFAFEIDDCIKYYKLTYSWSMDYDPEWKIYNNHEITDIEEPIFKFPGNRDWLTV